MIVDNHSKQCAKYVTNTTSVAMVTGVDSGDAIGDAIGDGKAYGEQTVDYESIITAILSANEQREMATRRLNMRIDSRPISANNHTGPSRRNLRSHSVKCSAINTWKVADLDEDTPYPLQPLFDVNFNAQNIQDNYCLPPTDNDLESFSNQVGLHDYSDDIVVNISEPQHCSYHNEVKFYPFQQQLPYSDQGNKNTDSPSKQSFTSANLLSNDKSNDPCDISTHSVPSPTRPSLNSKTPLDQEFLFEDTKPKWMQLDEYANVQSLRAPDGVTGVLYIDDIFSELLE
ncbi:uncharacterized protein V1513DRAFT_442127 [Lipomyces chichibuensis]|uniref:uncharacterized protein n=1 Tax=Lipomyces chichibuensis TaxID=1546026 RepID=UPI003343520F